MSITERVAAGIARCDERAPEGWRDVIDLERLDIASSRDCVIGQLNQAYEPDGDGYWTILGVRFSREATRLGFLRGGDYVLAGADEARSENQALTDEWRRQLGGGS